MIKFIKVFSIDIILFNICEKNLFGRENDSVDQNADGSLAEILTSIEATPTSARSPLVRPGTSTSVDNESISHETEDKGLKQHEASSTDNVT